MKLAPSRQQAKVAEELRLSRQHLLEQQRQLLADGRLFEDEEFPASWRSLGAEMRSVLPDPELLLWKRPQEICADPKFVSDGTTRFDVRQGAIGDCWLLAAVASLSMHPQLFNRVVPQPQEFSDASYSGMVRFRFWQFGEWKEVVIDDRLPTYDGSLVFMHSTQSDEFWSALLEKAYAKVMGSYEALKGGSASEAMEDFTGGVSEIFDLGAGGPEIFDVMLQACRRRSLIGCGINADASDTEAKLQNGLIIGHAYSVTAVELLRLSSGNTQQLVRVRNPWGNEEEWRGAWCDGADDWLLAEPDELRRLRPEDADDGEFWMSFEDFAANFHKLEICSLGADADDEDEDEDEGGGGGGGRRRWEATQHHGRWLRGASAGGCRKFLDTFCCNPQFRLRIVDADDCDGEEMGSLIVALMQKNRRRMRARNQYIGYMLYKLDSTWPPGPLPKEFFKYTASSGRSPAFADSREVTGRHRLPPGDYVLVPSTFDPNEEADFLLRVFSEQRNRTEEIDDCQQIPSDDFVQTAAAAKQAAGQGHLEATAAAAFAVLQGEQCGLNVDELMLLLNTAFAKSGPSGFEGFSKETCRSLLAFMDTDKSGHVEFEELKMLWKFLRLLSAVFKAYDADSSGNFSSYELRQALGRMGYRVSNCVHRALVLRYAASGGGVAFDDFVIICVRLRIIFREFTKQSDGLAGAACDLDQFVEISLYT